MKRIVEAIAKEVNFGSDVMVQLTICKEGKNEYLIIADSGEFKVWGISDIDVLSHYLNDSAENFDPQYRCVYEDQKSAFSSDYAPFFRYAENILTGFAITTGE